MANRFFPNYPDHLITSPFGMRTMGSVTRMHNGIDLTATADGKTGQTDYILAHTGGTVESAGYNSSAGNYLRIRTDDQTRMVYYHLKNKSKLQPGDAVQRGQVLGYMGSTGNATGPHLHFGIQRSGKWIDPQPYLDKDYLPFKMVGVELPVLQRGAKGSPVKALQALLNHRLAPAAPLAVDGSFGAATLAALRQFQTGAGLVSDGSCGPLTWAALLN